MFIRRIQMDIITATTERQWMRSPRNQRVLLVSATLEALHLIHRVQRQLLTTRMMTTVQLNTIVIISRTTINETITHLAINIQTMDGLMHTTMAIISIITTPQNTIITTTNTIIRAQLILM